MNPVSSALRTIAVVGGSLAGLRAVEALRKRGFEGRIVWVGEENRDPYDRPPLSKQMLVGTADADRIVLRRDPSSDRDVTRYFGRRAVRLDSDARKLLLDDDTVIAWDGLVIATGASPRNLPGAKHLAGVFTLRTLDDAERLRTAIARASRVVVIGAGFIGLEVASSCRRMGRQVVVLETLDVPLEHALGREIGASVASMHRAEGVDLRTGVRVKGLVGSVVVEAVELDDGTSVRADVVVVGIGVTPNTAWLDGSGVAVDDGVLCDERLAASVPNVVAAGDVARFMHPLFGEQIRVEHWTNAVEQANAAVSRLLEGPTVAPFASVPYFWSDQYDVKLQFAGRSAHSDATAVVDGDPNERRAVVLYGREGKLTGVLAMSKPAALIKYRKLIAEKAPFPG